MGLVLARELPEPGDNDHNDKSYTVLSRLMYLVGDSRKTTKIFSF